ARWLPTGFPPSPPSSVERTRTRRGARYCCRGSGSDGLLAPSRHLPVKRTGDQEPPVMGEPERHREFARPLAGKVDGFIESETRRLDPLPDRVAGEAEAAVGMAFA